MASPLDILLEIKNRLVEMAGAAPQSHMRKMPGTRAHARSQGIKTGRRPKPDIFRSTVRLGGALGRVGVPFVGEAASMLSKIGSLASAWNNFKKATSRSKTSRWRGKIPDIQQEIQKKMASQMPMPSAPIPAPRPKPAPPKKMQTSIMLPPSTIKSPPPIRSDAITTKPMQTSIMVPQPRTTPKLPHHRPKTKMEALQGPGSKSSPLATSLAESPVASGTDDLTEEVRKLIRELEALRRSIEGSPLREKQPGGKPGQGQKGASGAVDMDKIRRAAEFAGQVGSLGKVLSGGASSAETSGLIGSIAGFFGL